MLYTTALFEEWRINNGAKGAGSVKLKWESLEMVQRYTRSVRFEDR